MKPLAKAIMDFLSLRNADLSQTFHERTRSNAFIRVSRQELFVLIQTLSRAAHACLSAAKQNEISCPSGTSDPIFLL